MQGRGRPLVSFSNVCENSSSQPLDMLRLVDWLERSWAKGNWGGDLIK